MFDEAEPAAQSTAGASAEPALEEWERHPVLGAGGRALCALLRERHALTILERDATLAEADQPVLTVDFLLDGALRVFHRAPDGREVLSRIVEAPAVVGDAEALQDVPHARSVEALERSRLLRLPVDEFRTLLEKVPALLRAELRNLAGLCCVGAHSELAVLGSLEQRIASVLLAYAERYGRAARGAAIEIAHPLSLRIIARSVGGVWRSVGHVLTDLRHRGLVGKREELFVLEQPEALKALAAPILGGLNYRTGMDLPRRPTRKRPSAEVAVATPDRDEAEPIIVEDELLIGCQRPVGLLLRDPAVCPRHARIFRSPTGNRYWLQDLRSETGTWRNGEPVTRVRLRDGDRIKVGRTEMVFRLSAADAAVATGPAA